MPISRYDYQSAVWLHPLLSRVVTTLDQKLQSNLPQLLGRTEIVAQHLSKYASVYREYKLDKICVLCGTKTFNNLHREQLIIPLHIDRSCPDSLRDDLPIELVEELKYFIQQDYSFPHSRPLEVHTHFLLNPLHDQDIENLHRLLAPLLVLIIYTTITDCQAYIRHLAWWIVPTALVEYLSLHSWDWEELLEKFIAEGMKESQAVRLIRHAVRRIYQFILVAFTEWYYSFIYGDSYLKVLQGTAPLSALDT